MEVEGFSFMELVPAAKTVAPLRVMVPSLSSGELRDEGLSDFFVKFELIIIKQF